MSGCGCESLKGTAFGTVKFTNGSTISTNACTFIGGNLTSQQEYQSFISGKGTVWDINSTSIGQGASTHAKIKVSDGAIVNINSPRNVGVLAGFVKFTDFDTVDDKSTVNLNCSYSSLLSLGKSANTLITSSGLRVSFDKIEIDTVGVIKSPSTDRASIPFSGTYRIDAFIDCTSTQEQSLNLFVNDTVIATLPIKNVYTFSKVLKLNRNDVISLRAPSSMPAQITVNKQTGLSILKI